MKWLFWNGWLKKHSSLPPKTISIWDLYEIEQLESVVYSAKIKKYIVDFDKLKKCQMQLLSSLNTIFIANSGKFKQLNNSDLTTEGLTVVITSSVFFQKLPLIFQFDEEFTEIFMVKGRDLCTWDLYL